MESRAWTVTRGTPAPQAAGKIHTDLCRGFIRMETVSYEDLVAAGGWAKAQAAGKLRIEGKEYLIQDGRCDSCAFFGLKKIETGVYYQDKDGRGKRGFPLVPHGLIKVIFIDREANG